MEMYGYSFQREEDLMHHGIKGMKWGVRRWQNSDGSFNEAGKKRYFSEGSGENYRSVGGTARRALAKVYDINERYYSKHGNQAMASANKAVKDKLLAKADAADRAKSVKKEVKAEKKAIKADERSAKKATSLAKIYELNEKVYTKLGNRTMASMNKAAKQTALKRAAESEQSAKGRRAALSMIGS